MALLFAPMVAVLARSSLLINYSLNFGVCNCFVWEPFHKRQLAERSLAVFSRALGFQSRENMEHESRH